MSEHRVRPKKPEPKDHTVNVRFSREQYAKLLRAALAAGLPVAVYCRAMVMSGASRPLEDRLRSNVLSGATVKRNRPSPPSRRKAHYSRAGGQAMRVDRPRLRVRP